jgi:hypothetical protein
LGKLISAQLVLVYKVKAEEEDEVGEEEKEEKAEERRALLETRAYIWDARAWEKETHLDNAPVERGEKDTARGVAHKDREADDLEARVHSKLHALRAFHRPVDLNVECRADSALGSGKLFGTGPSVQACGFAL